MCSRCRAGRSFHREVHVVWPPSVASWLEGSGMPVAPVPEHNPHCAYVLEGGGPKIRSPLDGDEFMVRPGIPPEAQQIALVASVEGSSKDLFWFVDDRLLGRYAPGTRVMLDPTPGYHRLVAVDGEGRSAAIRIRVE